MVNILNNSRSHNRGVPRRDTGTGSSSRNVPRGEGNKIYVANIDFSCTHQDVKDLFKDVAEVAFVEMLKDSNQKPKGCAIVRFKENNVAEDAISRMNRFEFKGRKLVVKDERDAPKDVRISKDRKRPREDDGFERPSTSSRMENVGQGNTFNNSRMENVGLGNTFGLSYQFLESLGIDGPLVNRVFVANLEYSANEENLKQVFEMAGKVTDVELARGDDGKSKGFGFIEFEHPVEAVQAISMLHNQIFHDRPLSVQLTRKERKREGPPRLPQGLRSVGVGLGINGAPLKDVARTIDAGNQSSLLGAMPSGSGASHMDMNNLAQTMQPSLGMGGAVGGSSIMAANLGASGIGGPFSSTLGSDMTSALGRGGLSLMDRPSGLNLGMGIGAQGAIRSGLAGDAPITATSSNFSNFAGTALTNTRNILQISNLPNDYQWKSLQALCSSFGEVTFAKITSRGVGVVTFDNDASARRANDMLDHQRFEGRYLETRLL